MRSETIKAKPFFRFKKGKGPSIERGYLVAMLNEYGPNRLAEIFHVSRPTLHKAINHYNLKRKQHYE